MLVLTRGVDQQIKIGDNWVTVTILEVDGSRVRIGIQAPREVPIRRSEVPAGTNKVVIPTPKTPVPTDSVLAQ